MSTPDRPEGALSPWSPPPAAAPVAAPAPAPWAAAPEADAPPPRALTPRVVARALRRHWWQILAVWAVGSAGLVYLAYTRVKPTYDAQALLEVDPPAGTVFQGSSGPGDLTAFMETQVLLVTSPDVLLGATSDPEIARLPKVRNAVDPDVELRKEIAVAIPKAGTHLIVVKMTGEDPREVAAIVNAVTKSYLQVSRSWLAAESEAQIRTFEAMESQLAAKVKAQRDRLREMSRRANSAPGAAATDVAAKDGEAAKENGLGKLRISVEQYRQELANLSKIRLERRRAEAYLQYHQEMLARRRGGAAAAPPSEQAVAERVKELFWAEPRTAELLDRIEDTEARGAKARGRARKSNEPTIRATGENLADLQAQLDALWASRERPIRARVLRDFGVGGPDPDDALLRSYEEAAEKAQLDLVMARQQEKAAEEQLKNAAVELHAANNEAQDVEFEREDLRNEEATLTTVRNHLKQLVYEGQRSAERIKLRAKATPLRSPSSNRRAMMMAAAPVLMLALACALFVLVEARSGRVADPDELSHRARLGVIGVVPPLPVLNAPGRALSPRGQREERRRVEEFIQSLDHLRVTLCADRPGLGRRRCVLITSATGGEGKTTLAAQLAGRCANAGLMTLLIDADLRRPSLGDLLEVPEGPGLVDVLSGDAEAEAAMVVIGNAGGFHLLPAGTIGQDPSRLLHGDRLGQVIHRFRETFDMVIVDAPPVLAVPDALLLGRWTDGAVLAVRHDASRFPLVERANSRLASVGVPVLGAVVNGCRTMESAYGSYRYTPYAAADAPGGAGGES